MVPITKLGSELHEFTVFNLSFLTKLTQLNIILISFLLIRKYQKYQKSISAFSADLLKLSQQSVASYQMDLSFGLAHPVGSQ